MAGNCNFVPFAMTITLKPTLNPFFQKWRSTNNDVNIQNPINFRPFLTVPSAIDLSKAIVLLICSRVYNNNIPVMFGEA